MNLKQFKQFTGDQFGPLLETFKEDDEFGYANFSSDIEYQKIGYATNITPEVIHQAAYNKIQMIITHHDAWPFIYGMKEKCIHLLKAYDIAHFYVHAPLDYIHFGTCNSLMQKLGIERIIQQSSYQDGAAIIGVGEYDNPISFSTLVSRMSALMGEKMINCKNSERKIKRVGVLTGAGQGTNHVKQALDLNCDVYLTGEKTLYTLQYARFINMNIIVGSHTFTEIFGVQSFVYKLKERFEYVDIMQLHEDHFELPAL